MILLETLDAILVAGGFGQRGVEGKLAAIKYARENKIPYLRNLSWDAIINYRICKKCIRN